MQRRILRTSVIVALLASACGQSTPTSPTPPPADVAGTYSNYQLWLVQFVRPHDGYSGSFSCSGSLTLTQVPGSSSLTGFAVVGDPCPAISFPLAGVVEAGGGLSFTTGGPRPAHGSCPAPTGVVYTGSVTGGNASTGGSRELSMRGSTSVECPGAGEGQYNFDIILDAFGSL